MEKRPFSGQKAIRRQGQVQGPRQGFQAPCRGQSDGEDHQVKDLPSTGGAVLRLEGQQQPVAFSRLHIARDGPDKMDPAAGLFQKGRELFAEGLNVHVKERDGRFRLAVPYQIGHTQGVAAADLGAVRVPQMQVAAADTLDEGEGLGGKPVGGF